MNRNKWQIIIGWVLPILLILILLIFVIPFPIRKTVTALEINMADESYVTERSVTLSGYYHINLFTSHTFSGTLTVSGYDYADGSYPMHDLQIGTDSTIQYDIPSETPTVLHSHHIFGNLYSGAFFSDMMIAVFEHNSSGGSSYSTADATVIVANAADRQTALEIAEDWFYPNE